MRILIDTNIFIHRESQSLVPDALQGLLKILHNSDVRILIHPLSIKEIEGNRNSNQKEILLSKIETYPRLESPPESKEDDKFQAIVGEPTKINDYIDNSLLYCVLKNAVDFLITEDKGIRKKAERLGIAHRVLNIDESFEYFKKQFTGVEVLAPPALEELPVHNLDLSDPIFDSLKEDYPEFSEWWGKISREGRKAWVYQRENELIGAILMYKDENESVDSEPSLPAKPRIKISTQKVTHVGYKIGELFIKMSIDFAIQKGIDEIYLTHFSKTNDELVDLIEQFGFHKVAVKKTVKGDEDVFVKRTISDRKLEPITLIAKEFYPSFYDGEQVNKFIVPIWPEYHARLFPDYGTRQLSLLEYGGDLLAEGNAITKAYLGHPRVKKMSDGDILLFYRSRVESGITALGVIEDVYYDIASSDDVIRIVGKRTVFDRAGINEMTESPVTIIKFRFHFYLKDRLNPNDLQEIGISTTALQSILQINHENYLQIKKKGGIDERFTVD